MHGTCQARVYIIIIHVISGLRALWMRGTCQARVVLQSLYDCINSIL